MYTIDIVTSFSLYDSVYDPRPPLKGIFMESGRKKEKIKIVCVIRCVTAHVSSFILSSVSGSSLCGPKDSSFSVSAIFKRRTMESDVFCFQQAKNRMKISIPDASK